MSAEDVIDDVNTAIVFDTEVAPQVTAAWFEPAFWRERQQWRVGEGGRGGVAYVDTPEAVYVLRHYRRGGAMAAWLGDRYVWQGRDRTRGFAEFRLLRDLYAMGLPVPRAVAARYQRAGRYYTADLMTQCIEQARTVAQYVIDGEFDHALARAVGALIARFHLHGVYHADLNAHNVLVNPAGLYLIDFDRGVMRTPAASWQRANLSRLRRSLIKLGAASDGEQHFERGVWTALLDGYAQGMAT
ncbi:MAG: 3-deoxy-D-manno-octulosonic acid kinase [Xanthomonadales bacterium]|nr:3-deoxy-D-manno-octulosonic acid kinase [Xanthomonadales bacterium]